MAITHKAIVKKWLRSEMLIDHFAMHYRYSVLDIEDMIRKAMKEIPNGK
jgi:hypothetical protein